MAMMMESIESVGSNLVEMTSKKRSSNQSIERFVEMSKTTSENELNPLMLTFSLEMVVGPLHDNSLRDFSLSLSLVIVKPFFFLSLLFRTTSS